MNGDVSKESLSSEYLMAPTKDGEPTKGWSTFDSNPYKAQDLWAKYNEGEVLPLGKREIHSCTHRRK